MYLIGLISSQRPHHFLLHILRSLYMVIMLSALFYKDIVAQGGAGLAQLSGGFSKNSRSPDCKSSTLPTTLLLLQFHSTVCPTLLQIHDYKSKRLQVKIPDKYECDSMTIRLASDITCAVLGPTAWDSLIRGTLLAV